ncbi:MAG: NHL repeat-containing protein, partial [Planctomycetota bacterium]
DSFAYQIEAQKKIDPALFRYEPTHQIAVEMPQATAVAIGPDDSLYVAGQGAVHVFDSDGALQSRIAVEGEPTCLAVGGPEHAVPGRIYLGVGRSVALVDADGTAAGRWDVPGPKPLVTAVAVGQSDVFVADCGGRVVLRYDTSGELIGRIGHRDEDSETAGFIIPSPFFDVALAPDGYLWVVNPGVRRLEAYSFDGNLELYWGEASTEIEGFFGCCNPAHIAVLPDGRFVTAEKGLVRVKVYSSYGEFDGVVAGPEQLEVPLAAGDPSRFDHEHVTVDVAADGRGRVLVLSVDGRSVQVFEPKTPQGEEEQVSHEEES